MPGGDGQGPWWGQGRWNCWRGYGRGFGMGRGFGRGYGMRNGFFGLGYRTEPPQYTKEQEISEFKSYANELKAELDEIKRRMSELSRK